MPCRSVIDQAFRVSAEDGRVAFNGGDTTARRDLIQDGGKRTETYDIRDGQIAGKPQVDAAHDPSSRANLARFVAHGGGLQSDTHKTGRGAPFA
jgi:hypothetical protein